MRRFNRRNLKSEVIPEYIINRKNFQEIELFREEKNLEELEEEKEIEIWEMESSNFPEDNEIIIDEIEKEIEETKEKIKLIQEELSEMNRLYKW